MRILIFLCFSVLFITPAFSQVKAVEDFVKGTEGVQKFYIYQSSLRMLNQEGDEDFNKLIRNVRKINVFISEGGAENSGSQYDEMGKALARDDFESLLTVREGQIRLSLLSKERGSRPYYILTADEGNSFGVMEMDGNLDLRYLQSLEKIDFNKLRSIVGQESESESQSDEEH